MVWTWWLVLGMIVWTTYTAGMELYRGEGGAASTMTTEEFQGLNAEIRTILADEAGGRVWLDRNAQSSLAPRVDEDGKLRLNAGEWGKRSWPDMWRILAHAGAAGHSEVYADNGIDLLGTADKAAGTVALTRERDRGTMSRILERVQD